MEEAPWCVVPANYDWSCNLVVADCLVHAREGRDPRPPKIHGLDWKTLCRAVSQT